MPELPPPERDAAPSRLVDNRAVVLATCFIEGASVLVVEIAGARALAPFFGTSLVVWTSQITATLLFLALGYHFGGRLSRAGRPWALPALFWTAGLWLCGFPFLRNPILGFCAEHFGLAGGSLAAAIAMFGVPLGCFGAVSPVLIEHWNQRREGAGNAAGNIFFTNTIGGLAGAWLTALVLVPSLSMRVAMSATGILVIAVGIFWSLLLSRTSRAAPVGIAAAVVALTLASPRPLESFEIPNGRVDVLHARGSWVGLIQVVENPDAHWRAMLIDGVTQGGIDTRYGYSFYEYAEYLNVVGHRFHPEPERALILGLGPGVLGTMLAERGVEVEAIELDPAVTDIAREYFGLPDSVVVHHGDARERLAKLEGSFDLVFIDAFAAENAPWHIVTREGLAAIGSRLAPGGRVVANSPTGGEHGSPGQQRLESALLEAFGEARVFVAAAGQDGISQAVLVAGNALEATGDRYPGRVSPAIRAKLHPFLQTERAARDGARITTDDHSDFDYVDRELRSRWREQVTASIPAGVLAD